MTEQNALWDDEPADNTYVRPAHIDPSKCGVSTTNYQYHCRCTKCKNLWRDHKAGYRICKVCQTRYHLADPEAGSKYCSTKCKEIGYNIGYGPRGKTLTRTNITCHTCGAQERTVRGKRQDNWQICKQCLQQLIDLRFADALGKHHAPPAIAHGLLANPNCQICQTPLGRVPIKNRKHKWRVNLAIDHDHTCCPNEYSCGQCIRGWLCHDCNQAIGQAHDDPTTLRAMADYLDKWKHA